MSFTPNNIVRDGKLVAQEGIETELASTNDYVEVFTCDYSKWQFINLGAKNTGSDTITVKVTGKIHASGEEYTLIEKDITAGSLHRLLSSAQIAYSRIILYVKSTVADTPGTIKAEYFMK